MNADHRRTIDWEDVKQRLRRSQQSLEQSLSVDDRRQEQIFRQRAERLASRARRSEGRKSRRRYLMVELAGERFGVELPRVKQVVPYQNGCPVPGGPSELAGVMNVRGDIVSVVDLRQVLGLSPDRRPETGMVLLVDIGSCMAGLLIDAASGIQDVADDDVIPIDGGNSLTARFVAGRTAEGLQLLGMNAVFEHPVFQGRRAGG